MAIEQDAMNPEEIISDYLFPEDSKEIPEDEVVAASEEEADDVDEEIDTEDEDVVVDEEVEEEEPDAPWMPNDLDELAAAMEVDLDDLKGSIQVKTKVDGVEGKATLAEVIKNYQLNKSLTERSEAFAHKQKQFEQAVQSQKQLYDQKIQEAEAMTQVLEDNLRGEVSRIDWDTLRREDPAEYAALTQEYTQRIGMLEQHKQKIIKERTEAQTNQQREMQEKLAQAVAWNANKLIEVNPDLQDTEKRTEFATKIKDYLRANEVSDQEISGIYDYRVVNMIRKAMAYDEMQTKVKPAKAKAKTKPKFTKPGTVKTKADANDAAVKRKYKRAAESQNVDAWADVLLDRL